MPIEIKKINKKFGDTIIFSDFSITIPNTVCAIMAASGVGKTTLMRILAGLDRDFTGEVTGIGRVSYCPQDISLFPWYSAKKNIAIFLNGVDDAEEQINKGLAAFGLSDSADKKPNELSGGMCQRVAILRAWLYPSDTVILDEPFKGLDPDTKEAVISYLNDTKASERTVIFTTHSKEDAELFADKIIKF